MAGLYDDNSLIDNQPLRHIPVLLEEVMIALGIEKGHFVIDGTFGAGGYTRRILEMGASVLAIDVDPIAIAAGRMMEKAFLGQLMLVQGRFSMLGEMILNNAPDSIVFDIGVSSMQIDEAERGFSFQKDGPLDMRMSREGVSAAEIVNQLKVGDLARIFHFFGEERHAGRIAHMVEKRRTNKPFMRTRDLAHSIELLIGRRPWDRIHPATRVFQALRIFVNDELSELVHALFAAERVLKPGGRLVVVTFHSLEDRIVKRFFANRAGHGRSRHLPLSHTCQSSFIPIGKGIIVPLPEEKARNPRARSAKLRAAIRTDSSPLAADFSIFKLPKLPNMNTLNRN